MQRRPRFTIESTNSGDKIGRFTLSAVVSMTVLSASVVQGTPDLPCEAQALLDAATPADYQTQILSNKERQVLFAGLKDPTLQERRSRFQIHVRGHSNRTKALGLELFRRLSILRQSQDPYARELKATYPQYFVDLNAQVVNEYLGLHDQAKLEDAMTDELLVGYHETHWPDRTNTVERLNARDTEIRNSWLMSRGFIAEDGSLTHQGWLLKQIENIADLVDRGHDPVAREEFSKKMSTAVMFLASQKENPLEVGILEIIQQLELDYGKIVGDRTFFNLITANMTPDQISALRAQHPELAP